MEVLIIEDELPAAEHLQLLLSRYNSEIKVLDILDSVERSVKWLKNNPLPDLIFMDIQLADGISFKIFNDIQINCPLVFTTAYDQYAIQAFKVNSVDYLLKPLTFGDLSFALEKFKNKFGRQKMELDWKMLSKLADGIQKKEYKSRFIVKIGEHIRSLPLDDISFFFSKHKATYIRTMDNRTYMLDSSLELLERQLDPQIFFRINRRYLIQYSSISDILRFSGSRFKLHLHKSDEDDILVSRDKVNDFKEWLDR